MRAAFALGTDIQFQMFTPEQLGELTSLIDIDVDVAWTDYATVSDDAIANVEILITGWGAPLLDARTLERMPYLAAVIHTAGSVKEHLSPAVWNRGIRVTTAAQANAVPVAEFALAMILLAGKDTFLAAAGLASGSAQPASRTIGNYRSTVGIIGCSRIGRRVLELLAPFDLDLLVFDPFITPDDAATLGARLVDLPTLLSSSHVVSLHAPHTPTTHQMITASGLALIQDGATIVNTARPGIIDDDALQAELVSGRLNGILDVTDPEPLPPGHILLKLPNVFVTPHLAGARGNELSRLGASAIDEVRRVVAGESARYPVSAEHLASMA